MTQPKDGGPAFPLSRKETSAGSAMYGHEVTSEGMTLRDWFAGRALIALLHAYSIGTEPAPDDDARKIADRIANRAYFVADAMLEARKR